MMQAMNGDALRIGSGSGCDGFTEDVVAFVADTDPVERTEDDRLTGPHQDDAPTSERDFIDPADGVVSHDGADGGSRIDVKRGQCDAGGGRRGSLRLIGG